MMYRYTIRNEDTPILVSVDNGGKQFVIYREEKKKNIQVGAFKLLTLAVFNMIFSILLYLIESVFMGMKGLKR